MNFPSVGQSKLIEKRMTPSARTDLARLRRLVKHASSGWLEGLDMERDCCAVIVAVLEDLGSRHCQIVSCDIRVFLGGPAGQTLYHRAHGFRIFDDTGSIFLGLRAERDPDLACVRSVKREHHGCVFERTSTWEEWLPEEGFAERADPRNSPHGRRLVDEGVSLLRAHDLTRSTPVAPRARRGPRL